ncbi:MULTISPECIES: SDR family oxidoreductase [Rhodococcus]|jgi:NADP-dependent 3-hydroxy acid dehydrogenase YdfG|uniref:SDR family oxidoreductase n=1 Tax=Rhodococcus erythropolis TaxID=1833 RepID=A0A8I1A0E9_RHOER|nr:MULTISPECIES: SDR family oxidoreductase [Rhodococcus]MCW0191917.1 SDR family oxidoreductase [Rhodococcus sp. (in: high G+C Gram-positive bacteria)]MBF7734900.1 SDR family oxidoreductase [Rhodococcus erythropolis]MBH5146392.1 SDR family oxidoreductase [Rhodococcus erythropolis]MCJ0900450.1 SDR family oxidoreductase [Rhodococcus sp. ARC_M13]MCQ4128463.1 SDR family oxidoreductase [Rhodococcus erythropolis]
MPRFEPNPLRRPALISGASSGIGTATAYALAELGHPVALGARRVTECEAIAEKIRSNGGEAFAHFLDVTDGDSVDGFVSAAEAVHGPTEMVVSGAGDLEFGAADEMDPEAFSRQIQVHLVGAQRLAHRVLPGMRQRQRGDFVLIGSDCAERQRPLMGAYDAAKAGLEAMGRQMRMELEGTGIRASIVRPGPTLTGMGMDTTPEIIGPVGESWSKWGFARHGYFLRASDIANAIVAVVSAPRGAHIVLVEVQPEAPLDKLPTANSQETT